MTGKFGCFHSKFVMRRSEQGFTLVEMLLVLVILATLAAIVVPRLAGRSQQAMITAAETQIANFASVLDQFEVDNGFYPQSSDGLYALVEAPSNAGNWRGPYLNEIPLDPWGGEYRYEYPGRHNTASYDIQSAGPDGRLNTEDDITNW